MKTVIVTGANGALGQQTTMELTRDRDLRVVMAGRRPDALHRSAAEVNGAAGREAAVATDLNLASFASIHAFVDDLVRADLAPVYGIVANAGIQVVSGDHYSEDGYELTFAVNHLANFLLVDLLLPHCTPDARIVVVSSGTHDPSQRLNRLMGVPAPRWESPELLAHPTKAAVDEQSVAAGRRRYATSKLCNILFVRELASRLRSRGSRITANAFDPGLMPGTGLARDARAHERFAWRYVLPALVPFVPNMHTVSHSARNLARLVSDPGLVDTTGAYFEGTKQTQPSAEARADGKARELWEASVTMCRLR
jgi:NAD(P)-dependent dehydrogenase (short-subunit alcohol dehydrogenase family)